MLENNSTRTTKKPAAAAKKAAPKVKVAVETSPIGDNGEVAASQAAQATTLVDSMPDLVRILAENIRHNTELLKEFDRRRAEQTGDRPAVVEQLRTILDYKAIGQMLGRTGTPFQGNLIDAYRENDADSENIGTNKAKIFFLGLPNGAEKVSVQVDGDQNPKVLGLFASKDCAYILDPAVGKDIGRIEILNSKLEPISLGPRIVAAPQPPNTL